MPSPFSSLGYLGRFRGLRCPYSSTWHVRPAFKYPGDSKHCEDAELLVLYPVVKSGHPWPESQVSITDDRNSFIFRDAYFCHIE